MGQNAMKNQARACRRTRNRPQAGSALFIVFIMIALFAALTMAISRGSRTGTTAFESDKAKLAATEVLEYSQKVRDAVKSLLINGCKDTELSFANTVYLNNNGTLTSPASLYPNAPSDKRCDVFQPAGANLQPRIVAGAQIPIPHLGGAKTGNGIIVKVSIPQVGTSEPDLVLQIPHVREDVCKEINKTFGVSTIIFNNDFLGPSFNDDFSGASTAGAALSGKTTICYQNNLGDPLSIHFYQVLIAR